MEEKIKFDPNNFRIHSEKNKRVIRKSLEECGAGRSVLMDKDNFLIAGNGVYEQAKELGIPLRIIETDGKELVVVKRKDLSTDDDKRKILALADNHASDTSEFDLSIVVDNFSDDILKDWEFDLEGIEVSDFPDTVEKADDLYTKKIVPPIYVPKGEKPKVQDLYNTTRSAQLSELIEKSNVDEDTKNFLKAAASRHIVFDYGKIAEFYAHSSKEVQELMEESALVIIDFDRAIEQGYVKLKQELKDSYEEDYQNDEE